MVKHRHVAYLGSLLIIFLSVTEAPLPVVVGSVQDPCLGMVVPVILKPSVVSILVKNLDLKSRKSKIMPLLKLKQVVSDPCQKINKFINTPM